MEKKNHGGKQLVFTWQMADYSALCVSGDQKIFGTKSLMSVNVRVLCALYQ